jgi:hypothetical protein
MDEAEVDARRRIAGQLVWTWGEAPETFTGW